MKYALTKRKKPKTTKERARALAIKYFSQYIKLRDCLHTTGSLDYGACITCGEIKEYNKLDCGHFIPGRRDPYVFEETNAHAQCIKCNRFEGGRILDHEDAISRLYGKEEAERLKLLRHSNKAFSEGEYRDIARQYRQKIKAIKEQIWTMTEE